MNASDANQPTEQPAASPSRRAALGAVVARSAVALLTSLGREATAAKKEKRRKKRRCPKPNVCPVRVCCKCVNGCKHVSRQGNIFTVCNEVCAQAGGFTGNGISTDADDGVSVACNLDNTCVLVTCPL